jgi:transposase
MHKIKEVLRLSFDAGLSPRQVAASLGVARSTVRRYLDRAQAAGVGWPLPAGMDETALERALFPPAAPSNVARPDPDFNWMHKELRRKGVTLQLLWMEYKDEHRDGYQYSQFCARYQRWRRHLDPVLRQDHRAGEKCFIDFSGQTIPIVDADTGAVSQAELFVAVLGASNFTYAEAVASQQLSDWIGAHTRAFEFFDAVPAICVPDNLRSGVDKANRYEPSINRSYLEMARHYGTVIIPARPYRPRDKAKVEVGVQVAERWILASLRNLTFTSIAEANAAIRVRLRWLNDRPFSKLEGTRRSLFTQIDRPAMAPLPARRYEYAVWRRPKVNIDYHVDVDRHYYSVPYQLIGAHVDARVSAHTVELFYRGNRVAAHPYSAERGRHSTEAAHMPPSHRAHQEWSPSRLIAWGQRTVPATGWLIEAILAGRPHPEQGYRSCLGILRLSRRYGEKRLEAACARALRYVARSYRSVESILAHNLDAAPLPTTTPTTASPRTHEHVRGPDYYH